MTSVLAVIKGDTSFIGADTLAYESTHKTVGQDKVFIKENMLVGVSGSYAILNCFRYHLNLPKRAPSSTPEEYIHKQVYKALRNILIEYDLLNLEEGIPSMDGQIIMAYEGKLFVVQEDFSILEPKSHYYSIGSGTDHCLAAYLALDLNVTGVNTLDKIKEAIRITSFFCPSVSADTTTLKLKHK